jgi:hypothetical protein
MKLSRQFLVPIKILDDYPSNPIINDCHISWWFIKLMRISINFVILFVFLSLNTTYHVLIHATFLCIKPLSIKHVNIIWKIHVFHHFREDDLAHTWSNFIKTLPHTLTSCYNLPPEARQITQLHQKTPKQAFFLSHTNFFSLPQPIVYLYCNSSNVLN